MAIFGETSLQQLLDDGRLLKRQAEYGQEICPKLSFRPSLTSETDEEQRIPYSGDGAKALLAAVRQLLNNISPGRYKRCKVALQASYQFAHDASLLGSSSRQAKAIGLTRAQLLITPTAATLTLFLLNRPRILVHLSPHSPELNLRIEYPELRDFFADSKEVVADPVCICLRHPFRTPHSQVFFYSYHRPLSEFPPSQDFEKAPAAPTTALSKEAREKAAERIKQRQQAKKQVQLARAKTSKLRDLCRRD